MIKLLKILLGILLMWLGYTFLLRGLPFEAAINYIVGAWLIFSK